MAFAALLSLALDFPFFEKHRGLCPQVQIQHGEDLTFTDVERELVCGRAGSDGWQTVPRNQARYTLTTFLQARGYYHPTFTNTKDALVVELGKVTTVATIKTNGLPAELDMTRFWLPLGKPLTPAALDQIEGWVRSRLKALGYGCPQVKASADPHNGMVTVNVKAGEPQLIRQILAEQVDKVNPDTLRRYDAITVGDLFNDDDAQLTAGRTLDQQLLLSTFFTAHCDSEGITLKQSSVPGPPHLTTVGVGFDTETYVLARGTFRNSRIGDYGSVFDAMVNASYRQQQVSATGQWYLHAGRQYLKPTLSFERDVEPGAQTRQATASLIPTTTWDSSPLNIGLTAGFGPALNLVETIVGVGPKYARIASLDGNAELKSHDFEFNATAPRQGFRTSVDLSIGVKGLSSVAPDRGAWSGEALWNIAGLDPPVLVLGVRARVATTLIDGQPDDLASLPPTYRFFLGGSQDVRGFGYHSLPSTTDGGLSTAYVGTEARLASVLPYGIEPIVFLDVAGAGEESLHIDHPYYWSPGGGIRWQSPVGSIRTTLARGFVVEPDKPTNTGWNFFFSLGEEF